MNPSVPSGGLAFHKMHGLGNDFVVLDRRTESMHAAGWSIGPAMPALVRALADRHRGVGFDQLAVIEADLRADMALSFYNADGSVSQACGNATRCIARREMDLTGRTDLTLRTGHRMLLARDAGGGLTRVNMGEPLTAWQDVPVAHAMDTLHLPIPGDPVATGMGNPHCTFFVGDAAAVPIESFGPAHENSPLFPQRTNVEIVQVLAPDAIRLRVWERGTGVTLASGSCACAAAAAAVRRGLTGRQVRVEVDGGTLHADWRDDGIWLTGPSVHVFSGWLTADFLASVVDV